MTDELIDILDSEGKPTGARLMKSEAHARGLWHYSAHVWIFNSKGEVLLQKRAIDKESHPGLWDISSAGHVSAGETPDHAAVREVEEELGIKISAKDLKFWKRWVSETEPKPGFHNKEYVYTYFLRFDGGMKGIRIQKEELDEVKFMPLDEFEADIRDKERVKAYVPPKSGYFLGVIDEIRKELKSEKF
ncbi:MAG: NUDIX domain-containing protein [Candidatus Aenigmatarchaeota archaeon]